MDTDELDSFGIAPKWQVTGASSTVCHIDTFDIWIDALPENKNQRMKLTLKIKELKGWKLFETKTQLEKLPLLLEKEAYSWAAKSLLKELQELGFQARMTSSIT